MGRTGSTRSSTTGTARSSYYRRVQHAPSRVRGLTGQTDTRVSPRRLLACHAVRPFLTVRVVVQDGSGASDFEALQKALGSGQGRLIFYAFDLLHLDDEDVRDQPLLERRRALSRLIGADDTSPLQFSQERRCSGILQSLCRAWA